MNKEKYIEMYNRYQTMKSEVKTEAKTAIAEMAKDIFNKFHDINSFGWSQYTPYFNDGDSCTFSVNNYEDSIYIDGQQIYDLPEEICEKALIIGSEVSEMLQLFDDEFLEDIFGDHVLVTFNRNGEVTTEYYNHD